MAGFGYPRRHFRSVDSTNQRAREMAVDGAPHGTVVTAAAQTAGRGRQGRTWAAPPGTALLLSAILRPLERTHRLLPLAAALAVCDAAEELAPVACQVKWPNDVWIDRRKVAGILIEALPPEWAVIGIGLNLAIEDDQFPADLRWPAASLGHGAASGSALPVVCRAIDRWCGAPDDDVISEFRRRDGLRGQRIAWDGSGAAGSGQGIGDGIDRDGNLVVTDDGGRSLSLGAGEVQLLRP